MSDTEKTIFKQHRRNNFTVVPNDMLRDTDLSWQETGMMAYLLSLPDDWEVRTVDLVQRKTNGRDAVKALQRSLAIKGYLHIERGRRADGKWYRIVHVFEEPMRGGNRDWKPGTGNPARETRRSSKDSQKEELNKQEPPLPPGGGKALPRRARCAGCGEDGVVGTDLARYVDTTQPKGQRTKYLHSGCEAPPVAGSHTQISKSNIREDWL